jgi:predicted nucleotidyltransferase
MSADDGGWLDELAPELNEHAALLRGMLSVVEADSRVRAMQVQGSVGRGEADALSDIDVGLVVAESAWPRITGELKDMFRSIGDLIDEHYHFLPSEEAPELFKAWAHFESGIQLDVLVLPASRLLGSGPDGRTLLDRDKVLLESDHPRRLAEPGDIDDWAFLAWQNLTEVLKYIQRGRAAAAAEWLNSGRQAAISCWAAANGVEYAAFANVAAARLGVSAPWPDGLEKTYPGPSAPDVIAAAKALAALQTKTDRLLELRLGLRPRPLGEWVRQRLERLEATPPRRDNLPARSIPEGR